MPFVLTENCVHYNKNVTLVSSTFKCDQCNTGYYLKEKDCVARLFTSEFCKTFNQTADECSECMVGYFLS